MKTKSHFYEFSRLYSDSMLLFSSSTHLLNPQSLPLTRTTWSISLWKMETWSLLSVPIRQLALPRLSSLLDFFSPTHFSCSSLSSTVELCLPVLPFSHPTHQSSVHASQAGMVHKKAFAEEVNNLTLLPPQTSCSGLARARRTVYLFIEATRMLEKTRHQGMSLGSKEGGLLAAMFDWRTSF